MIARSKLPVLFDELCLFHLLLGLHEHAPIEWLMEARPIATSPKNDEGFGLCVGNDNKTLPQFVVSIPSPIAVQVLEGDGQTPKGTS